MQIDASFPFDYVNVLGTRLQLWGRSVQDLVACNNKNSLHYLNVMETSLVSDRFCK